MGDYLFEENEYDSFDLRWDPKHSPEWDLFDSIWVVWMSVSPASWTPIQLLVEAFFEIILDGLGYVYDRLAMGLDNVYPFIRYFL